MISTIFKRHLCLYTHKPTETQTEKKYSDFRLFWLMGLSVTSYVLQYHLYINDRQISSAGAGGSHAAALGWDKLVISPVNY